MNLTGRSAVITGANQGLGRAIAEHYVRAGASVLLVASIVMVSTLFGMGPPPQDPAVYLATRGDQQLRYMALMVAALVVFGGFTILSGAMQDAGDRIFSRIALAASPLPSCCSCSTRYWFM